MSSGTGSTPKVTVKSGGSPRTMAIGVAVIAAGLGAFYYSQSYAHKKDDQTYLQRQNVQRDDKKVDMPAIGATSDPMKPKKSGYFPIPPR